MFQICHMLTRPTANTTLMMQNVKNNKYGEGSECKLYSGYEDDWLNDQWCYADVLSCPDAKKHADDYGQDPGYGASKAACQKGKYTSEMQ